MITATLLAIFFVPVFFVVVRRIFKGRIVATAGTPPDAVPPPDAAPLARDAGHA
jgi:multidrug efflux pump